MRRNVGFLVLSVLVLIPAFAVAQQTGSISGKVIGADGLVIPGVTVEARSSVLPTPRMTVTGGMGEYRLPALPPGDYTLTFELSGMAATTKQAQVQLAQDTKVDATMSVGGVSETVEVTATATFITRESSAVKSTVSSDQIQSLPVGQQYRDLIKLIPGVQFTQDGTRGPSAGGSGQDNVYQFDGVNVTLPLFGTLSAEPASHDIAQVTTIKGGAKAVDFERAGGFSIDSVSKSGTNKFSGQLSYQIQSKAMASNLKDASALSQYEQNRTWLTVNGGGPVIPSKLYFYASYYRPTRTRDNRANLYGELPNYESTRNEGFGKLTFSPISPVLFNFSYRNSHRIEKSDLFASTSAATTGAGSEAWQRILTADGSWVINAKSFLSFKYTHFENPTQGRPDNVADVTISTAIGTRIDVNNLDKLGSVSVPSPVAGQTAYNEFIQPLIDRYGYILNGVKTGGGTVGYSSLFDKDEFYRDAGQVAYNITFGSAVSHDLHFGYQYYVDSEDLERSSNGWGTITAVGGRLSFQGSPIYYQAAYQQQTTGAVPVIHSEYRSQNFEVNDTIRWNNWSFNAGLLASNDTLYGQGLRNDSSTISGYTLAPGNKYKMYEIPFSKMLQPRVGATWAYNGTDTLYGSFARYNPAASSLPRAAAWDRNVAVTVRAYFDANGVLFGNDPLAASSGKLFVKDMTPRTIDEFLVGTARQITPQWSGRLYYRYREGSHFWEDTNNDARVRFNPPEGIPRELYIPDLTAMRTQIGSGSTYVIAELDGAYTKYHEVTVESEWRASKAFVRGSYTWSKYYGNFDQDNSTVGNDANIFIGSSNIADDAGRQLWNFRDGTLRGDRPHMLKLYGYYMLPWQASVGAYGIAQSGQPWETWSYEPYAGITTSTSETSRYAEKAGSRRSAAHYQMDLNYTQNFRFAKRYNLQLSADLFNVFDKQTGYSIEPRKSLALYGTPRAFFDPRRLQVAARFQF